ncbi:hypothetical protein KW791_01060 [Candidatus Parcubacteria bacterium]|nr:hypothetical protein [Candidatus Parcubacteria bacterium]
MRLLTSGNEFEILALEHQRILTTNVCYLKMEDFLEIIKLLKICIAQVAKTDNEQQKNQIKKVTQTMTNVAVEFMNVQFTETDLKILKDIEKGLIY